MNIPKEFIILQNILFVKGFLNENAQGSFNDEFHSEPHNKIIIYMQSKSN